MELFERCRCKRVKALCILLLALIPVAGILVLMMYLAKKNLEA